MFALQVILSVLNHLNRKTTKSLKICLARKTQTKKVQKGRKVQLSLCLETSPPASRPRSDSCSASAISCARACRRGWDTKRSSAKGGWNRERRPAPPESLRSIQPDLYSRLPET